MTAFTPDRPDWTREDTASIVYEQQATLAPGGVAQFGLVGVASYLLYAYCTLPNQEVVLDLLYGSVPGASIPIMELGASAAESPNGGSFLIYESPSYGGGLQVTNLTAGSDINLNVYSSNRVVAEPRYLFDLIPGQSFEFTGAFVAATPVNIPSLVGGGTGYTANVNAGLTVESSDDGDLLFYYRDFGDVLRVIPVGAIAAGVTQFAGVPLPQCVGQFWFLPTANNPTGDITVLAYPART